VLTVVSREKIDRLAEAKEYEESQLYRGDGTKLYSDEEHAEREADIRRRFRAAMDEVDGKIETKVAAAEESLLVAENADPTDALTSEELASANARRPFVSDEVFTLPLDKLEARCRAVLAQGDRPAMFLYALYGGQRAGLTGDESPYRPRYNFPSDSGDVPAGEDTSQLHEVVSELWRKVNPDGEEKVEKARGALQEAGGLKDYAYMRRRGAKDVLGLYRQQNPYNVPTR
jgi:hypothetical protein